MEEQSKGNRNLQIIVVLLMILSVAIVSYGMFVRFNGGESSSDKEKYVPEQVVVNEFNSSFLKIESNKTNLIYSPLSIRYALSMLQEGANGATKDEIVSLIGNDSPTKYNDIDKVLSLANSIFIRDSYKDKVKEDFINLTKEKYNVEVYYDSFQNASNVNNWISKKTFNLLNNIVRDEQVQDKNLEMILINALAIDMEWLEGFDKEDTLSRPFTKEDGSSIDVAMMYTSSKTTDKKYYQDEDYNVISMPLKKYDDTQLEFIAIMPRTKDLDSFINGSELENDVNKLIDKLHKVDNEELNISIPRFDFDYSLDLTNDLKQFGIKKAFSENEADFTNIADTGLFVKDSLHKANIKFSEEGIKASAATVIYVSDYSKAQDENAKYLVFDKPFMFLIKDCKTNELWFIGTVYEPLLWKDVEADYKYE